LDVAKVRTNIIIFDLKKSGWSSADFLQALAKRGVLAIPVDSSRIRMVTHLDVNRTGVENAVRAVRDVLTV
jgi:threonine aldolase